MSQQISIFGPGAIGLMLGYYLKTKGFSFTYWGRSGPQAVKAEVSLDTSSIRLDTKPQEAVGELCFICVKAYHLPELLSKYGEMIKGRHCRFIMNGYFEPLLKDYEDFQKGVWQLGSTNIGVKESSLGVWNIHKGDGSWLKWGMAKGGGVAVEADILAALACEGFSASHNILEIRQEKWLMNTVINSLCAWQRLDRNIDLLGKEEQLRQAFEEAYLLASEIYLPWKLSEEVLYQRLINLLNATAENENSMARDLRLGRPTESAYLAGIAYQAAGSYPFLQQLHRSITKGF